MNAILDFADLTFHCNDIFDIFKIKDSTCTVFAISEAFTKYNLISIGLVVKKSNVSLCALTVLFL